MDSKTSDSLTKLSATSTGRRRLVQAAAAAGMGGFVSRRGAAAQDFVAEACKRRQASCNRKRECQCSSGGADFENVTCDRLKKRCNNKGDRCCGQQ